MVKLFKTTVSFFIRTSALIGLVSIFGLIEKGLNHLPLLPTLQNSLYLSAALILEYFPDLLFISFTLAIFSVYEKTKEEGHNTIYFNSGLGPYQIWKPCFLYSILIGVFACLLILEVNPKFNLQLSKLAEENNRSQSHNFRINSGEINKLSSGLIFYAEKRSDKDSFEKVFLKFNQKNDNSFMSAASADLKLNFDESHAMSFHFKNGSLFSIGQNNLKTKIEFDSSFTEIERNISSSYRRKKNNSLSLSEHLTQIFSGDKKSRIKSIAKIFIDLFFILLFPFITLIASWLFLTPNQSLRFSSFVRKNPLIVSMGIITAGLFIKPRLIKWLKMDPSTVIYVSLILIILCYAMGIYLFYKTFLLKRRSHKTIKSS